MKTQEKRRRISRYKKHKQRVRFFRILALFVVCAASLILLCTTVASERKANITISVKSAEILQGEELPQMTAEVKLEGNEKAVLDKEKKYTAKDLVEDLKNGKGYKISCKADTAKEGSYPIKIVLDKSISGQLDKNWMKLVEIEVKDGDLQVKNKIGEWDGDKFKRYDGSYIENGFVVSREDTYYFDAEGKKVTGWQTIQGNKYYFNKNGAMQKSGWQEADDGKYYLGEKGAALTGWQELDGDTYYFGQDGKMATGEIYLGIMVCRFDEDGKLLSKKESSINPDKPMVALTFDDGPGKRTHEILEQLEKYKAHATFFMLGQKVPSYKDTITKMKAIGCELGNHSYDHANLSKLEAAGVIKEVGDTNSNIKDIVGSGATVMRPPYGAISETVKKNVGMPMILWNIDTLDWKIRNAQTTIDTVMEKAKDGDIILMHDIHTESVDAALELIPKLEEAGFQLVTVSELAGAKGIDLKNGEKYTDF